jgi:putative addiction module killer protein
VYQIQQTDAFITWLTGLRDMRAKARIVARLEAVRLGNLGDIRSVGDRVSELRVDVGGGYRVESGHRSCKTDGTGNRVRIDDAY